MNGAKQTKLPAVPEDITAEWLAGVLGRKIQSATIDKVIPGTATKVLISVVFENDDGTTTASPQRFCVKGGFDPSFLEAMPFVSVVYQREAEFYSHVAPSLTDVMDLPTPAWAGTSTSPANGVVVMDGLTGASFGDPRDTWPVSRVLAGVEQLAALHAGTWGVEPKDYPWLTQDYDQVVFMLMQAYDAVVRMPGRPKIPEYLKDQARVTTVLRKHFALRNPRFRCLVHGDPHQGNTYLVSKQSSSGSSSSTTEKKKRTEFLMPRFLDYQVIHIGSAFFDVAYFIAGALSVEDRRAREWDIVEHYLRSLEKFGVETPLSGEDEEVRTEYKKNLLAGVGWIVCPEQMQPLDCIVPMAERYAAALDDHKVLELVEGLPEPAAAS